MGQVFPKSNWGQSTWRGKEAGKRAIKGGEEQLRKGFKELERKSICKNERERERERERKREETKPERLFSYFFNHKIEKSPSEIATTQQLQQLQHQRHNNNRPTSNPLNPFYVRIISITAYIHRFPQKAHTHIHNSHIDSRT